MTDQPVAIVTGAGSGIGRATALRLSAAGHHTVLVGRTAAKLEQTRALLVPGCAAADVETVELSKSEAVRDLVRRVADRHGRIDAIANVAGDAPLLPIERVTADIWRRCIDTNLSAIVDMTAAVWPVFRRQQAGTVVNVSSLASFDPFPGFAIYASAKVAVNMFTRCTASEGAAIGVRAVCIAPGAVETPMLRALFPEAQLPRASALDPDTVAALICDCISGKRSFEAGETIRCEK